MKIDLLEFARQGRSDAGQLPVARMTRVDTPDPSGSLAWTASGSMNGRHGAPRLDLTVDGSIVMTCQRCLQPMSVPIDLAPKFLIAADEATADALDEDDEFDVVVGSTAFDVDALIEDEVILALPIAPRHAVCPDGATAGEGAMAKPSPFAALAGLKIAKGPTEPQ